MPNLTEEYNRGAKMKNNDSETGKNKKKCTIELVTPMCDWLLNPMGSPEIVNIKFILI